MTVLGCYLVLLNKQSEKKKFFKKIYIFFWKPQFQGHWQESIDLLSQLIPLVTDKNHTVFSISFLPFDMRNIIYDLSGMSKKMFLP